MVAERVEREEGESGVLSHILKPVTTKLYRTNGSLQLAETAKPEILRNHTDFKQTHMHKIY